MRLRGSVVVWTVALALALAGRAGAQSLKLPDTVSGSPGAWVVIVPLAKEGGAVKWWVSKGLAVVPLDKLFPEQKSAGIVVQGPTGVYHIHAWCALKDVASDLATCMVVIGDPPPPGPGPGPGPGPEPTDPLYPSLKAAWAADASPAKAHDRDTLALIYRGAAGRLTEFKTMSEWSAFMGRAVREAKLTSLAGVQRAIGDELNARLPRDPAAALDRALVGAQLARMAGLLEALR